MRVLLFLKVLILSSLLANSQEIVFDTDSSAYRISDTSLLGAKSDLHRKAQGWVIDHFNQSKQPVRLDDMDTGELIGKGSFRMDNSQQCSFTFNVSSRDRSFECEVYDILVTSSEHDAGKTYDYYLTGGKKMNKTAEKIDKNVRSLLKDLHKRMRSDKNFSTPSAAPVD